MEVALRTRVLPAIIIINVVCGCDPYVGIKRTCAVDKTVEPACVKAALSETDSVIDEYQHERPPQTVSVDCFHIRTDDLWTGICLKRKRDKQQISMASTRIGTSMARSELKKRKAILNHLYRKMRQHCENLPKADKLEETCLRVSCK